MRPYLIKKIELLFTINESSSSNGLHQRMSNVNVHTIGTTPTTTISATFNIVKHDRVDTQASNLEIDQLFY